MHFHRLTTVAWAVASVQAAVLPRQETTSALSDASSTRKSYLTSITSLPMPTSVEGNTAYPPKTTSAEVTTSIEPTTSQWSSISSKPSSRPPFTWHASANSSTNSSIMTGSSANATTSSSAFATGLTSSAANAKTSSSIGRFANSTSSIPMGTAAGIAATGTAVQVTGAVSTNATASSTGRFSNSTTAAPASSTSMIVQLYLSMPTTVNEEATATDVSLGSNMTLVVSEESTAQATISTTSNGSLPQFANSTTAAGFAKATDASPSANSTTKVPLSTGAASASSSRNATAASTSSSSVPLSTGSSSPSAPEANAIDSNGTMFAVTYDNKNGTIVRLVPASNSTNPLAPSGTAPAAGSTGTASASLGRREVSPPTGAPITPAREDKKSWSKNFPGFAYAHTDRLNRPSRWFSGDGWSWGRSS